MEIINMLKRGFMATKGSRRFMGTSTKGREYGRKTNFSIDVESKAIV